MDELAALFPKIDVDRTAVSHERDFMDLVLRFERLADTNNDTLDVTGVFRGIRFRSGFTHMYFLHKSLRQKMDLKCGLEKIDSIETEVVRLRRAVELLFMHLNLERPACLK